MLNMRCWCESNQLITLADSKEWRVSSVWTWRWCTGTLTSSGEHWRWWDQQSAPSLGPVWPTPGCNLDSNSSFIIHCLPSQQHLFKDKESHYQQLSSNQNHICTIYRCGVHLGSSGTGRDECAALWNVIHPWTDSTYMQPGLASLACLYSAAGVHQYLHYLQFIPRSLHYIQFT